MLEISRSSVGPRIRFFEENGKVIVKASFDVHTSNGNFVHISLSPEEAKKLEAQLKEWREQRG